MWKCPECGRTFKNVSQHHFCGKAPETVDEYILAQEESVRDSLQSIRTVLKSKLPDAEERISWSMPTYWKGHNIIHFAAQKKHIGLYPGPEAVEHSVRPGTAAFPGRRDCGMVHEYGESSMKRYESDAVPQEASDTLMFFDGRPDAWKLYQAFEEELYSLFPTVNKRVQKNKEKWSAYLFLF